MSRDLVARSPASGEELRAFWDLPPALFIVAQDGERSPAPGWEPQ